MHPTVWVLLGSRAGDDSQSLIIADALGWPYETKQLVFARASQHGHHVSYATLKILDRAKTDPLTPPWPDLVIATGRTHIPVALWIKQQSQGKTKLVHLNRPQTDLRRLDLVLAMPQFRMPDLPNIMRLKFPLMRPQPRLDPERLAAWQDRWKSFPRPWSVAFVGGPVIPYRFDSDVIRKMTTELKAARDKTGGTLFIVTSPRTPPALMPVIKEAQGDGCVIYDWQECRTDNPYQPALALMDKFIVTGDSVSMLTEAIRTGKPVQIYRLPFAASAGQSLRRRVTGWLHNVRAMDRHPWRRNLAVWIHRWGIFPFSRDFETFHHGLIESGHVAFFGEKDVSAGQPLPDELPQVVARIRQIMGVDS